MSFKKLPTEVREALQKASIQQIDGEAKTFFSNIKSGKHCLISATENSGKTFSALISIFNKVHQEHEGSPRALFLTDTIENAQTFYDTAKIICKKLDITVDLVHDKGNSIQQRNDIFDGTEIIVGNPKRVNELYLQNGINLNLLELFIVDNLDFCLSDNKQAAIKRLIESLGNKTQIVLLTNSISKKTEGFLATLEIPFHQIAV